MLVGAFHGHAHNRKCQLDYLATYVLGLGLEDLAGAERLFSRSNGLSRSVQYASVFHRRQTYANLSMFLVNNYKQAIEILDTEESLKYAMEQAGVTEDILKSRIQEEKAYLNTLLKEPQEETDQMEYYQLLVNLADRKEKFDEAFGEGSTANGNTRRHARENYNKVVEAVQATEHRLSIELVVNRWYRRAVDSLEALVVKRLLELTKVNQSGLGYKVRKHIAKALQVRSKAIRSALQRYNSAALALDPPRQHLSWEEVIGYAFLADFDILWDPTGNATIRAWADPAARQLLDSYHKLKRAKEEIQEFLLAKEAEILPDDPTLAFFIGKYRWQRGRYDEIHTKRFYAIRQKLGNRFTADLTPGERADPTSVSPSPETDVIPTVSRQSHPALTASVSGAMDVDMDLASDNEGSENGWLDGDGSSDDDEGENARGEELGEVMEGVALLALEKQGG
ncbi:hypothetical protein DFH08DRAFT_818795 [Mycena albidolilacea]|uniref:Uncharacterized protein n=1 Tax=Mycena albidolilacea TaxID=1033008 RepID=A0AAD7EH46_9AGAR|nr:hypothetical protein DFH08DRAFT_818795 [Mycena albidolilacea]